MASSQGEGNSEFKPVKTPQNLDLVSHLDRAEGFQYIHTFLIILTNPSARTGYDTRSIFKWSLTGLNSEFSFS